MLNWFSIFKDLIYKIIDNCHFLNPYFLNSYIKPVYVEVSAKLKDCCGQFFVCKQISDKWGVINFETKFVLFDSSFYHLILACDLPLWNGLSSTNDKHIPSF